MWKILVGTFMYTQKKFHMPFSIFLPMSQHGRKSLHEHGETYYYHHHYFNRPWIQNWYNKQDNLIFFYISSYQHTSKTNYSQTILWRPRCPSVINICLRGIQSGKEMQEPTTWLDCAWRGERGSLWGGTTLHCLSLLSPGSDAPLLPPSLWPTHSPMTSRYTPIHTILSRWHSQMTSRYTPIHIILSRRHSQMTSRYTPIHIILSHWHSQMTSRYTPIHIILSRRHSQTTSRYTPIHIILSHWHSQMTSRYTPIHIILSHWHSQITSRYTPIHIILSRWHSQMTYKFTPNPPIHAILSHGHSQMTSKYTLIHSIISCWHSFRWHLDYYL